MPLSEVSPMLLFSCSSDFWLFHFQLFKEQLHIDGQQGSSASLKMRPRRKVPTELPFCCTLLTAQDSPAVVASGIS